MSASPLNEAANDDPGFDRPDEPFPAEAVLAAAASIPLGPVGRFQVACAPVTRGEAGPVASAFLVDTVTGRTWSYAETPVPGGGDGYWTPLRFAGQAPDAPP